jgi:hypothetical protein
MSMTLLETSLVGLLLAGMATACSETEAAVSPGGASAGVPPKPSGACAEHAVCADHFFIDTAAPADCASGSECNLSVKLGALGVFHVNDEYPYKFKADDAVGVEFGGTDAAGKNVFSKPAGNWRKVDEKSGVMSVKFKVLSAGERTISGTFKLSVCSAETCLLEQRDVKARVVVK